MRRVVGGRVGGAVVEEGLDDFVALEAEDRVPAVGHFEGARGGGI